MRKAILSLIILFEKQIQRQITCMAFEYLEKVFFIKLKNTGENRINFKNRQIFEKIIKNRKL